MGGRGGPQKTPTPQVTKNKNVELSNKSRKNILPGVVKGPSPDGPTGIVRKEKEPIGQAECVSMCTDVRICQTVCVDSEIVLPEITSGDDGQVECVFSSSQQYLRSPVSKSVEKYKMLEDDVKKVTVGRVRKDKQKVWTKLRNGLYGWRVSYKVKKCLGTEADEKPSTPEQRPPSATGKKKSQGVPARGQHLFKTMVQEIASKEISIS